MWTKDSEFYFLVTISATYANFPSPADLSLLITSCNVNEVVINTSNQNEKETYDFNPEVKSGF